MISFWNVIRTKKWILLPVETKNRELYAKVFLACIAAERGWGSIVGNMDSIRYRLKDLPKGVFVEKSISPGKYKKVKLIRALGNRIVSWCEEGLIYLNSGDYLERRVDKNTFELLDAFFAWGNNQANDIKKIEDNIIESKVYITGNPRFDILNSKFKSFYKESVDEIKKKYGRIILINTKFGYCNSNNKKSNPIEELKNKGKIKTVMQEELMKKYIEHQEVIYGKFIDMVFFLSKQFSNHTIIIRPHPSENHKSWKEIENKLSNVKVIFEDSANSWILAADVMIHNNCTTGVEAYLLGKPSIAYRPHIDESVEPPLPNILSHQAFNLNELIEVTSSIINADIKEDWSEERYFASEYITDLDDGLASERIMDVIDDMDVSKSEAEFPLLPSLILFAKNIKLKIMNIEQYNYSKQKFPYFTLDEAEKILDAFKQATGRFEKVKVIKVDKDIFCFYKE